MFDRSILNEVAIHRELNHPNIIRLLDHQTEAAKRKTSLVMEYADDGSLQEKINEKKLDKEDIKKVFREVCQAIRYLHESKIVHGDIKPENVVMTKRGEAKLCDFGSASRFGQQRSNSGTLEYLAPESVLSYPQNHKVDVWALGILLFEMITGAAPFKGKTKDEIIKDMKRTLFFSDVFGTNCTYSQTKRKLSWSSESFELTQRTVPRSVRSLTIATSRTTMRSAAVEFLLRAASSRKTLVG